MSAPSKHAADAKPVIEHDRGLGTAYERYCFYQLLDAWARRLDVKSFVEGPVDGMAGVPSVYGVGLAIRGVAVTSTVTSEEQGRVVREIYAGAGATADVRVVDPGDVANALPKADMVLTYHALSMVPDWRRYLQAVAGRATKGLVVAVCNPQNWGVSLVRLLGRLQGKGDVAPPEAWHKEALAPELWKLGRVREHEYFDCPWWPDLHVSPGQKLTDRAKGLVNKSDQVAFGLQRTDVKMADRFVYDGARWPYFGGPGWQEELMPALLKHPSFEGSKAKLKAYTGHLHAFLVDVAPRTRQAKLRLKQVEASSTNEPATGDPPTQTP